MPHRPRDWHPLRTEDRYADPTPAPPPTSAPAAAP